jgi:hypothetical protein
LAGLVVRNLHQKLAEIATFEQTDQGLGCLVETVHDVFAVFELAGAQPAADVAQEVVGL